MEVVPLDLVAVDCGLELGCIEAVAKRYGVDLVVAVVIEDF